jgi:hypothetical protein
LPWRENNIDAIGRILTLRLQFDAVEKRELRRASIYPGSSVSCPAVTLRTRFFALPMITALTRNE